MHTTGFEARLKECKTIRECFTIQKEIGDNLSRGEELNLRAKYAGLPLEEAEKYDEAFRYLKDIEVRPEVTRQLEEFYRAYCKLLKMYAGLTLEEAIKYEETRRYVLCMGERPTVNCQLEALGYSYRNLFAD